VRRTRRPPCQRQVRGTLLRSIAASRRSTRFRRSGSQLQISTISTGGDTFISDPVKIISDDITNTIVILSTPEDYATIAKAIQQIDIVPRQVVIEG